jgi:hypothetical protein
VNFMITVPLANQSVATATLMTQSSLSCNPASSACVGFSMEVPAVNAHAAAFASTLSYVQGGGTPTYTSDARTMPFAVAVCSSATEVQSSPTQVSPGTTAPAANLSFTGCN